MGSQYLTDALKDYYREDFKLLLQETNPFWKLDPGVQEILVQINASQKIHSLYSKWFKPNSDDISFESYLFLAYKKETEKLVEQRMLTIIAGLNLKHPKEVLSIEQPSDNPNYNPKSLRKIGCIRNPDYFRLYHFSIKIVCLDSSLHDRFWNLSRSILLNI